jgi:hypothetical protein
VLLALSTAGCKQPAPRPPDEPSEPTPPPPRVDQAFLLKAFGSGRALANAPLQHDLDPRPGIEALIVIHSGGKDYQVAVVNGAGQVLARAPLGGKVLTQATITAAGELKIQELPGAGRTLLLPVETEVYHRSVCGILLLRYRRESLALIGELSTKCWRKEAGGEGGDPTRFFKIVERAGGKWIESEEEGGERRLYRWDEAQGAFLSVLTPKKKG